ncbi:response regulator transcription factor [Paenibacillus durus]|uniref:Chemotaxis protein CheY n=1 Tax=Paenibacillus durus ATCC 35681 TaxID=1333534 RepID=A0A0F7FCT5_PAEDU|nr:response regulator transcription factor [Paenibacillus durus]AKG36240.1 chemotaxis protein CheY [Paenibacillus durus ATCC 35681]
MNILIVEDEESIREVLKSYLVKEGWTVYTLSNGLEALRLVQTHKLDLIILDLMIPGLPGEEVCRRTRQISNVPLFMLTSKAFESDTINGLNLGADEYITKPFRMKEVIARIHAFNRRMRMITAGTSNLMSFNNRKFVINFDTMEVFINGNSVNLTLTEFKMLSILVKKSGKIYSRHDLSYEVMGYRSIGDGRATDAHIKNIRRKIEEDPKNPVYIVTKIGAGYKFNLRPDDEI